MNFGFLDSIVQQQLAEGKLDYNPHKSQIIVAGGELGGLDGEASLNFTPYQAA